MSGERVTELAAIRARAERTLVCTESPRGWKRLAFSHASDVVAVLDEVDARDTLLMLSHIESEPVIAELDRMAAELERLRQIEAAAIEYRRWSTASDYGEVGVRALKQLDDALAAPLADEAVKWLRR